VFHDAYEPGDLHEAAVSVQILGSGRSVVHTSRFPVLRSCSRSAKRRTDGAHEHELRTENSEARTTVFYK
jgi:hypothetical protein